jgi:hypothetical protein
LANQRSQAILHGLLLATVTVLAIIVVHGLGHGWAELSETGYWIEKAVTFVIMAAVFAVIDSFRRSGGKD